MAEMKAVAMARGNTILFRLMCLKKVGIDQLKQCHQV